jgi:hypothetical protein
MDEKVLVGDDSIIFTGDIGATEYVGNNTATVDSLLGAAVPSEGRRMLIVTARATGDSIFPTGLTVGKLFPAIGAEVPKAGDKFKLLTLEAVADASSWSLGITQSEIDVTRLNDKFRKYRLGKKDASGTLSSLFTVGVSDKAGGVISRNMELYKQLPNGQISIVTLENKPLYMLGYVNKGASFGEADDFIFCQIYMYNITLGGQSGNAQSFDASIRLTGMDPVFYSLEPQGTA